MNDVESEAIVEQIFEITNKVDVSLQQLLESRHKIRDKYKPRNKFNRWRSSGEGKIWKHQQYLMQKGACAICKIAIDLKGSHIDHELPISRRPDLALELKNLRITCAACNCIKGTSE